MTVRVVASIARPEFGAEQDVERFRRGDDDMRRAPAHALALARRRVAGAHPGADLDVGQALRAQRLADAGERRVEIRLDVVRQRLERRDVDDLRLVRQPSFEPLPHQRVDRGEEGGERLARAGRRGDQHMPPGLDRRPGLGLRRGRRPKLAVEPGRDRRVEGGCRDVGLGRYRSHPLYRRRGRARKAGPRSFFPGASQRSVSIAS